MSAKPIISVEGLSKKYIISHQQQASYSSLRDDLVRLARLPIELFTGREQTHEELWALNDVSFDVQQGDVVGIVGRNGSGKSTLLKVLSRIVEPTKGRAVMRGRVASLLEVGTGFHAELSGRENIYLNGAILGMGKKEIDRKFDEIVAFSEVEKFLDTPVKFYSSGMYVRLAFAIAAHLEPDILIVDEVLSVGDVAFQKKSLGKMKQVAGEGRTVIFVSHNAATVRMLCNKGILLSEGELKVTGEVEKVLAKYGSESFLASPSIEYAPNPKLQAQVLQLKLQDGGVVDLSREAKINIIYEFYQPVRDALVTCDFYAEDGTPLWSSSDADVETEKFKETRKPGKYSATLTVPPYTLTNKRFSIVATIQKPGERYLDKTGELYFDTTLDLDKVGHEIMRMNRFGYFHSKLRWDVEAMR